MEQLDLSFWLGLAAAIPLSIAANLLTPRLQQWAARRNSVKAASHTKALQKELKTIEELAVSRLNLHTFLLESVLLITLLSSMFGVLSGILFTLSRFLPLLASAGQLVAVIGGIFIMRECMDAIRKSRGARNFKKYSADVAEQLAELEVKKPNLSSSSTTSGKPV